MLSIQSKARSSFLNSLAEWAQNSNFITTTGLGGSQERPIGLYPSMLGWSLGLFCLNQPQHTVKRDFLKIILTFTELTITLCIVVNVIFMALDQYHADYPIEKYPDHPGMSPFLFSMLTNGNYFFTTIFAVESFVKLAAMSPRYFFAVSISYSVLFLIVYMYRYV